MSHNHDHYDGQEPIDHIHDHDHSHGGGHEHDHSDEITPALQNLLYEQIDFHRVTCLNEEESQSAVRVLQKTWSDCMNPEPELVSDVDEQIILTVPFTGQVRLQSILIRTSATSSAPSTLSLHINRDDLDFSTITDYTPTQQLQVAQSNSIQEYPVKRALFNTTRSLTLFFEDNWSTSGQAGTNGSDDGDEEEEKTRISYLGFKGEYMKLNKEPIAFLYEAAANPKDHKLAATTMASGMGLGSGR